nr:SH3 domain-containing protein [Sphingomonas sp. Y57]
MRYVIPAALLAALISAQPAFAADAPVTLSRCDKPIGSIAVVDGETQGWTKYGLSSPRDLIAAMAVQSNCFTLQNSGGGQPVDFLVNAIAGDKEEVDQGTSLAQTALTEGLVRSGMAGKMAGSLPFGGQALSMFGGFGGKKKTVAAGLRIISPANGQTLVTGSGTQTKTQVSIGGLGGIGGNPWADAARAQMTSMGYGDYANGGYSTSKDGQMLTGAFVIAFNNVVAQQAALTSARPAALAAAAPAAAKPGFTTAVDTKLFAQPEPGEAVRSLRAGTALTPTGVREGLFVEVSDAYGTKGWVSVEDLK